MPKLTINIEGESLEEVQQLMVQAGFRLPNAAHAHRALKVPEQTIEQIGAEVAEAMGLELVPISSHSPAPVPAPSPATPADRVPPRSV